MARYAVGLCAALVLSAAALVPTGEERSPHWHAVRDAHLKEHPVCEVCGGAKDLNVHHVEPFHEKPELELEPTNLITLCRHDHFYFGHAQSWRAWNPQVREDALTIKKIIDRIRRERKESPKLVHP